MAGSIDFTLIFPIYGNWAANPLVAEIDEIAAGSFKLRQPPEIKGTGYVVKSLEAALWAFYNSSSFAEGCLLAVNLGDGRGYHWCGLRTVGWGFLRRIWYTVQMDLAISRSYFNCILLAIGSSLYLVKMDRDLPCNAIFKNIW